VDRRGAVYGELASGFREALKGKEGAAARTIEYGRGESEAAIAERVAKEGKPSAVLIAGTAPDALHWKRLLEEKLGGEVAYLFGGGEADVPELLVAVGGEGLVVPVSFHAAADDERARAFVKAYREKFEEPPPAAAALAHDAVSVYAQALRRAA